MRTKDCNVCGETKPISEFPKHRSARDGYWKRCRICHGIKTTEGRRRGKARRMQVIESASEHVDVALARRAVDRANGRRIVLSFTLDELEAGGWPMVRRLLQAAVLEVFLKSSDDKEDA